MTETVEILSQSSGNPPRFRLTPVPSAEWSSLVPGRWAQRPVATHHLLPNVRIRVVDGELEVTGVTAENSVEVHAAIRDLVVQTNHRLLLNHHNRRSPRS